MSAQEGRAKLSSNDNSTAFEYFIHGYWNQMSSDLYSDLGEAVNDFKQTEGMQQFALLKKDILTLAANGQFPSISEIDRAYDDPFWSRFGRILTIEELKSCDDFCSDLGLLKA